jgi:NAD(P)-dependent dehydrogenase (short-subunit alcohol dehydrogenase family)
MVETATPSKRSLIWRLWGLIMFLLVAGALASSAYLFRRLQREEAARAALVGEVGAFGPRFEQFKGAVRDVNRQLSSNVFQEVDLAAAGWQPITGGFYVIDLSVVAVGKGTRIGGKIVNPTSVVHEEAKFSVRVDERRATFSLTRVPPAVAQPFEVTFPDLAPAAAKKAFVALDSSTINFASSTTRKRAGGDPLDTDKLLK